jgi:hypothetical protein
MLASSLKAQAISSEAEMSSASSSQDVLNLHLDDPTTRMRMKRTLRQQRDDDQADKRIIENGEKLVGIPMGAVVACVQAFLVITLSLGFCIEKSGMRIPVLSGEHFTAY